jgi:hypothetical protein
MTAEQEFFYHEREICSEKGKLAVSWWENQDCGTNLETQQAEHGRTKIITVEREFFLSWEREICGEKGKLTQNPDSKAISKKTGNTKN